MILLLLRMRRNVNRNVFNDWKNVSATASLGRANRSRITRTTSLLHSPAAAVATVVCIADPPCLTRGRVLQVRAHHPSRLLTQGAALTRLFVDANRASRYCRAITELPNATHFNRDETTIRSVRRYFVRRDTNHS